MGKGGARPWWRTALSCMRFLATSFVVNVQSALEYRTNFLIQVFGMALNNAAFAAFWAVLLSRTGSVGGYVFTDVMFIWAIVPAAFGLAHALAGNIRSIGQIVQRGELDVYLLQPRDVWLNLITSRTVVSAWGDFLYGFLVIALLPGLSPGRFALFCAMTLTGAAILVAAFSAAESLVFFMGDSSSASGAFTEFLLSFSLYPETVFDRGMRWVFYTIVPSGFVAFVPLAAYKALEWRALALLVPASLAYTAASYALFRLGLRRYESGNQVGTRS